MAASEDQGQGPVIRDRRRIDPVTGQPRDAQQGAPAAGQARGAAQPRPGKHAVSKPGAAKPAGSQAAEPSEASATDGAEATEPGTAQPPAPTAGEASQDAGGPGQQPGGGPAGAADGSLAISLAERTADLQRLQAEYANYRKRVERDRAAVREHALASVLSELLPVLDDIGRAREHGELTGGFKAVAESLEAAASKLGLTAFGEAGEAFDPKVHEALMHSYSPDVTETTCSAILQPGYKVGERILRPARVAVAEPTDPAGARPPGTDQAQAAPQGQAAAGDDATAGAAGAAGAEDRTAGDTKPAD